MVAEGTNANMTYEERYVDKVRHLIRTILGLDGVLIFTQTQIFHLSHHNYPYDLQMKECKVLGHSFCWCQSSVLLTKLFAFLR